MRELSRRRYYSRDSEDKAGILRYTKVADDLIDMADIPSPTNERELAWLLSFYWHLDQAYETLPELASRLEEGRRPGAGRLAAIQTMYEAGIPQGLELSESSEMALQQAGIGG